MRGRAGRQGSRARGWLAALSLCAMPWAALASQAADEPETASPEVAQALENTRRSVRSSTEWLARGVDGWFGNKPFSQGGKVSDGLLGLSLLSRQHENADFSLRFNARLRLPNLEDRAYLFLGRDDRREVISDKPDAFSRQQRLLPENPADRAFFAGIGLLAHESLQFHLGLRGGLKPYAQARYKKPWQLGPADLVELRETLFWSLDERLGSTTALSYEHAFSSTLAMRWLNAATITQHSKKFEWSSGLGAYQSFGDQRLLSLEALCSGLQGSGVAVSDYGLQLKWEQPLHKDWLLGELLIGHFWPRPDALSPRGRAWALGGTLKMKF